MKILKFAVTLTLGLGLPLSAQAQWTGVQQYQIDQRHSGYASYGSGPLGTVQFGHPVPPPQTAAWTVPTAPGVSVVNANNIVIRTDSSGNMTDIIWLVTLQSTTGSSPALVDADPNSPGTVRQVISFTGSSPSLTLAPALTHDRKTLLCSYNVPNSSGGTTGTVLGFDMSNGTLPSSPYFGLSFPEGVSEVTTATFSGYQWFYFLTLNSSDSTANTANPPRPFSEVWHVAFPPNHVSGGLAGLYNDVVVSQDETRLYSQTGIWTSVLTNPPTAGLIGLNPSTGASSFPVVNTNQTVADDVGLTSINTTDANSNSDVAYMTVGDFVTAYKRNGSFYWTFNTGGNSTGGPAIFSSGSAQVIYAIGPNVSAATVNAINSSGSEISPYPVTISLFQGGVDTYASAVVDASQNQYVETVAGVTLVTTQPTVSVKWNLAGFSPTIDNLGNLYVLTSNGGTLGRYHD